ncbi:MAG: glycosyltransferase family 2 protein [Bacteroidota bacterium]
MGREERKISALLITFNEEKNIQDVLENLDFADEIVVVDSFSTDQTMEIVNTFKHVKSFQRPFKNYTDQKQFALAKATYDWILFLDADERIPIALKKEILNIVRKEKETASAYYFLRTFMFRDSILRFSGWQTDKNYRLFKKGKVRFAKDRIVHETLIVDGTSRTLKHRLIHYSYSDYESYKSKMVKYGQMKAKEEFRKGKRAKWYHILLRPAYKFLNHYLLRLGFLDGEKGIIICYLNALGVWSRCREMKRLTKEYNTL